MFDLMNYYSAKIRFFPVYHIHMNRVEFFFVVGKVLKVKFTKIKLHFISLF